MSNPLATAEPWDLVAVEYDELVRPIFANFSRRAMELVGLQDAGTPIVDIACGPGTTTELLAQAGHEVDAIDFAPAMIEQLRAKLDGQGRLNGSVVRPQVMDGQSLDFPDDHFAAGFSMFGLMFFPERARGFRELWRVVQPGARVCVSSWLPLSQVPVMQWGFGAFSAIVPPPPPGAPPRVPVLEDAAVFQAEMEAAGFQNVRVERCAAKLPISDVDSFWQGMVRSSAPIALFRRKVGEERWTELNDQALQHLHAHAPKNLDDCEMLAWLGVGRKPKD